LEGSAAFIINPKYNLRFELGGVIRSEKNAITNNQTSIINFGLRSSFRNLYQDF
jgi:putative salt-induced outer membrane protein YdiY